MRFFNVRRKTLPDDELRDALFNAVAESNAIALNDLLRKHLRRVIGLFPTWTTLPTSVRSDPVRTKWWAEGLIGIASEAAALGDPSLMARLQDPPGGNDLIAWQEAFLAAEADAAGGKLSSAIRRLDVILEKSAGMTGTGVDHILPRTYGLLGTLNYRAGNQREAREFTLKAKEYCERIGDHEGAEIYRKNLAIIDAV
jgi:hypothetical protein